MPPTYRYGMGFYMAEKSTMDNLRKDIDNNRPDIISLVDIFNSQSQFELMGEDYKRNLNPELPPRLSTWYQKKSFYIAHHRSIDKKLYSNNLISDIEDGFNFLTPFYHYCWKIKS